MAGAPAEIGVAEQWHLLKPKTIVIPTLSRDPVEAESPLSAGRCLLRCASQCLLWRKQAPGNHFSEAGK